MGVIRCVPEWLVPITGHFEGLRTRAYHDPVGFPTQGYGRLLSRVRWEPLDKYPEIDRATAVEWLAQDLRKAGGSVCRLISVPLEDHQYAALVDFAFNVGGGNLQASALRSALNRGDYAAVPAQLQRWTYSSGVVLPGLVERRAAEAAMFDGHPIALAHP